MPAFAGRAPSAALPNARRVVNCCAHLQSKEWFRLLRLAMCSRQRNPIAHRAAWRLGLHKLCVMARSRRPSPIGAWRCCGAGPPVAWIPKVPALLI